MNNKNSKKSKDGGKNSRTPTPTMNDPASKDEKVNGKPRSDSVPGFKIYSVWSEKLAKDQVRHLCSV